MMNGLYILSVLFISAERQARLLDGSIDYAQQPAYQDRRFIKQITLRVYSLFTD